MGYVQSNYGPGAISTLQSGIGLTYGPTIGSNDPRQAIALGGLGVLARASSMPSIRMMPSVNTMTATSAKPRITTPLLQIFQPRMQAATDTNYVTDASLEPASDEVPIDDSQVVEPAAMPTWVWVVGGIAGLGLLGGLAWWALK